MKQCGDLTARVTVILSWNISGKSGRSWLLVRFTVILIQFGGVVIGGTSEKYGIKENFSRPICFLCFGGSPDVIIASVIGAVFGYVCCIFVGAAQTDALQLVAVPVMAIVEAAIISIVACLLATAIPLRSIARMSIVDSIETVE